MAQTTLKHILNDTPLIRKMHEKHTANMFLRNVLNGYGKSPMNRLMAALDAMKHTRLQVLDCGAKSLVLSSQTRNKVIKLSSPAREKNYADCSRFLRPGLDMNYGGAYNLRIQPRVDQSAIDVRDVRALTQDCAREGWLYRWNPNIRRLRISWQYADADRHRQPVEAQEQRPVQHVLHANHQIA